MTNKAQRAEVHASYRFAVEVDGINEAIFNECTLPPMEVEVHEQKEGGYNNGVHLLPGRVKSGRLTLKRGIAQSSVLLNWYRKIANGQVLDATRNLSVVMYDSTLNEVMRWNFERVYPVKWSGPALKSSDSEIAIESLELAYAMVTFD
jgi:phage tail-like protein